MIFQFSLYLKKHVEYAYTNFQEFKCVENVLNVAEVCKTQFDMNDTEFDNLTHKLTQRCIDYVSELPAYKAFDNIEVPVFDTTKYDRFPRYSKGLDIYNRNNEGKRFISIDLTKANFQSLTVFDALFDGKFGGQPLTYKEFIENIVFGEGYESNALVQYMTSSKRIRQVIFGNLNPKRQQQVERYMVESLIAELIGQKVLELDDFYAYTTDEIILTDTANVRSKARDFGTSSCPITKIAENELVRYDEVEMPVYVHIEDFILERIEPYDFYVKVDTGTKRVNPWNDLITGILKKVPIVYYLQVLECLHAKPITEEDMMFLYEKVPARFIDPLWNN